MINQVFRIFTGFENIEIHHSFSIRGTADPRLIRVAADTQTGSQPWILSVGESAADLLTCNTFAYQAARVSVAADPRNPELKDQAIAAAASDSGYFNKAGIPVGIVREIVRPDYTGERFNAFMVLGAAPAHHITNRDPMPGDAVFSLSSADGISSAAEIRKLLRLFRKERAARFIKRCHLDADGLTVTVSQEDAPLFCVEADKENLFCSIIDEVSDETLFDRKCLDPADEIRKLEDLIKPYVPHPPRPWEDFTLSPSERLLLLASDIHFCSQQGLSERFDASSGAGGVLAPHGGLAGAAPDQVSAVLIPAPGSRSASVIGYACDPAIENTFGAAAFSAVTSAAKLVAAGCAPEDMYIDLRGFSSGGDVSPVIIGFALATTPAARVLPSHFTRFGSHLYLMEAPVRPDGLPDLKGLRVMWERLHGYIRRGTVLSAYACEAGGAAGALVHMSLSGLGARVDPECYNDGLFTASWGSIVFESPHPIETERFIGVVQQKSEIRLGSDFIPLDSIYTAWWKPLESVFPTEAPIKSVVVPALEHTRRAPPTVRLLNARPLAVIPVFPGTTGEDDTVAAFEASGGAAETPILRDLRPDWLEQSTDMLEKALRKAQMLVLPGGFSDGNSFFRHPRLTDAVRDLLHRRGGLILGIGNGFQTLIRLGLIPFGDILEDFDDDRPSLTVNAIGRHQARYIHTRVSSVLSPWLMRCAPGEIHTLPVSHGEGRFTASGTLIESLVQGGQIAFQYCDVKGIPRMATFINPNGSMLAAEGITSPDGRVLGKMAHSERTGFYVGKNIHGNKQQPLFEGGVRYFR